MRIIFLIGAAFGSGVPGIRLVFNEANTFKTKLNPPYDQ